MEMKLYLVGLLFDSVSASASPETADPEVSLQCRAQPDVRVPVMIRTKTIPQAPASSHDDDEVTGTGESGEYEDGQDADSKPLVEDMLTDRQGKAIETVYQRAAFMTGILLDSGQYFKPFQSRGIDFEDAKRTMEYMAWEAPIIIHFKVEDYMLSKLFLDAHYKNLFETGASNGNKNKEYRQGWEDRVFGRHYHDAEGSECPKYGVLNLSKDPQGFRKIGGIYGRSYMVLKNSPSLRARCTVADQDTSHSEAIVTDVWDWKRMILLCWSFTDDELFDVTKVATGKKAHGDSTLAMHYKEVQIHGPVRLDEDVEELVLNPWHREKRSIEILEMIKKKHGINYSWMKLENEHKMKVACGEEDKE